MVSPAIFFYLPHHISMSKTWIVGILPIFVLARDSQTCWSSSSSSNSSSILEEMLHVSVSGTCRCMYFCLVHHTYEVEMQESACGSKGYES